MTILQLMYFIAVAEKNNLTRVAEEYMVSQPAISGAIRELEREYDLVLFNRDHKKMTLTSDGQTVYRKAKNLMKHYQNFQQDVSSISNSSRKLVFGITPILAAIYLPDILDCISEQKPNLSLDVQELSIAEMLVMLKNGQLDLACMAHQFSKEESELNTRIIGELELCLCAHRKLFDAKGPVTIQQIGQLPLALNRPGTTQNKMIREQFARAKVEPNILCEISQSYTLKELVLNGHMAAFQPAFFYRNNPEICTCHIEEFDETPAYLVWKNKTPQIEEFLNLTKHIF